MVWAVLVAATCLLGRYAGLGVARRLSPAGGAAVEGLMAVGGVSRRVDKDDRHTPVRVVFELRNPGRRPVAIRAIKANCDATCPGRTRPRPPPPVAIRAIKANCDCTSLATPDRVVGPGASVSLTVHVGQFDEYAAEFSETVRVVTDDAPLELGLTGALPPATAVRHRPDRIRLVTRQPGRWADNLREVVVVVPRDLVEAGHGHGPPASRASPAK